MSAKSDSKKSDGIDSLALAAELESIRRKTQELEIENQKLREVLVANDLQEELDGFVARMSDEEYICVNEIRKLRDLSEILPETSESLSKTFDIYFKNLRAIRGQAPVKENKSKKKLDPKELMKIVEGK